MKFGIKTLVLGVLGFGFATVVQPVQQADARVVFKESTRFYSVSGRTGRDIARAIQRRGPSTRTVRHAIATTAAKLDIRNIRTTIRGRRCVVTNADVYMTIRYTLPRLRSRNVSAKVRRNWKRFAARVRQHELVHGKIFKNYAREVEREFKRMRGRVSRGCSDFGRRSRQRLLRIQAKAERAHARFDRREGRRNALVRRYQRALYASQ